uniref:Uncharacterized protein n=1 Tax=viral metagenome TaxID=1070528 RepID=A0A6H1ZP61_9ZZZZ
MFIRLEVLKDLARKANPNKPFQIIISCDNKWTDNGNGVMKGPETTYELKQEGLTLGKK